MKLFWTLLPLIFIYQLVFAILAAERAATAVRGDNAVKAYAAEKWARPGTNQVAELRNQATNSLKSFKAQVTQGNHKILGFASLDDVSQATNGEPIFVSPILINQLRAYKAGQDFESLVGEIDRAIVPVMVGPNVASSLMLRLLGRSGRWTNENWGQPTLIQDLVSTYKSIPPAEISPGTVAVAANLPVMNVWFIAYRDPNNKTVLRSTADLVPFNLHKNQIVSVEAATNLSSIFNRYPGPQ